MTLCVAHVGKHLNRITLRQGVKAKKQIPLFPILQPILFLSLPPPPSNLFFYGNFFMCTFV